jgi:Domain of unknown function (DUF1844)
VSSLWTPGGEHEPAAENAEDGPSGPQPGPAGDETDEQAREQLRQLREQLAETPVSDIVANHAIGLWELALLHLSPAEGFQPDLEQAQLAIDAMAALVETLGHRLGRHEEPLREALRQLRLAFVEITGEVESGGETSG